MREYECDSNTKTRTSTVPVLYDCTEALSVYCLFTVTALHVQHKGEMGRCGGMGETESRRLSVFSTNKQLAPSVRGRTNPQLHAVAVGRRRTLLVARSVGVVHSIYRYRSTKKE